jgi:hypothetical protein
MKTKSNKVVPAELDGIPSEVATAMLCSTQKITNRMRKNCMAARQKVYPSISPIRKVLVPADARIEDREVEFHYAENASIEREVKLARRAKALKFCQLNDHHGRMVKRRAKAQAAYLKLMTSEASEQHKQALGKLLTEQASILEHAQDALAAEIKRRQSLCRGTSR